MLVQLGFLVEFLSLQSYIWCLCFGEPAHLSEVPGLVGSGPSRNPIRRSIYLKVGLFFIECGHFLCFLAVYVEAINQWVMIITLGRLLGVVHPWQARARHISSLDYPQFIAAVASNWSLRIPCTQVVGHIIPQPYMCDSNKDACGNAVIRFMHITLQLEKKEVNFFWREDFILLWGSMYSDVTCKFKLSCQLLMSLYSSWKPLSRNLLLNSCNKHWCRSSLWPSCNSIIDTHY